MSRLTRNNNLMRWNSIGTAQLEQHLDHLRSILLEPEVDNIILYIGLLNDKEYPDYDSIMNIIESDNIDDLLWLSDRGNEVFNRPSRHASYSATELMNPPSNSQSRIIERMVLESSVDDMSLVDEYREDVDGLIWRRIVNAENEYRAQLMDEDRQSERPDLNDPVGGLIDITDHIPAILSSFNNPNIDNWLVGKGISENRVRGTVPQYNLQALQKLITGSLSQLAVAGGFPLRLTTGTKCNDIDLFMIIPGAKSNPQPDEWNSLIRDYISSTLLEYDDPNITVSDHSVSIYVRSMSRRIRDISSNVQVILRVYHSLTEVLTGFDIGCCGVGLYNGRLYATERALYEIVNRTIMVSMSRASTSYSHRLIKYGLKGFGLYVEGVKSMIHRTPEYGEVNTLSNLEVIDLYIRYQGWIYKIDDDNSKVTSVIKLPESMTSDYNTTNNFDGKESISDYYASLVILSELPNVGGNIIYINPFRQGSLSFHPIGISLREWCGNDAVIEE